MHTEQAHLLVIKTGALGDLLVSTSALMELCKPGLFKSVGLLGPSPWLELLDPELWHQVKTIWVLQKKYEAELYINTGTDWKRTGIRKSLWDLRNDYQAVANLRYESPRYLWPFVLSHAPIRIGSSPWYQSPLYTDRAPWLGLEPAMHERDRNLQVISKFPAFRESRHRWFNLALPLLQPIDPKVLAAHDLQSKQYVLINPTASRRFKAWPANRFLELIRANPGVNFKVIGSPAETDWLLEVASMDAIVQPKNLHELCSIVGGARGLIANASSMHFIASSFQIPTLVLMGAARPEMWGPLGSNAHYLRGEPEPGTSGEQAEITGFQSLSLAKVQANVAKFLSFSAETP